MLSSTNSYSKSRLTAHFLLRCGYGAGAAEMIGDAANTNVRAVEKCILKD
jgi:hypothetical protein